MSGTSAAERFAAAKVRNRYRNLELFRTDLRFDLDPFQFAACDSLDQGRSVLVAAHASGECSIVWKVSSPGRWRGRRRTWRSGYRRA